MATKADKIVAFFQTRDRAEAAESELHKAGFDHNDTHLYNGEGPSFWQEMKEAFGFADSEDQYLYEEAGRRGAVALSVDLDDADSPGSQTAVTILQKHQPLDLNVQAEQWRQQGWQGRTAAGGTEGTARAAADLTATRAQAQTRSPQKAQQLKEGQQVLPVVQEDVQIGKRAVERGGVRVYSKVTERPVQEDVTLRQERATVERRAVDRPLGDADRAFQERTIEVRERGEEAVVGKTARVVEEVVVGKEVENQTRTVRDTVRRTDVEVEKLNPNDNSARSTSQTAGFSAFSADDYTTQLYRDQRFQGREWSTIETDVRSDFERRYPGSTWEQVKDSISRGWQKLKAKV